MTAKRKGSKRSTPFEPLRRSVYCGRQMLGRYEQSDAESGVEAFAPCGRSLGIHHTERAAIDAINEAAADHA